MPAPELNPDLLNNAPDDGALLGTTTRGNHATHGDAYSGGNQHIEKSCVVRQNIYCAKALEASAYTVRTSSYGDPEDPKFDPEHVYTTNIVPGFVKNDAAGNFLFGEPGDGSNGGATALDQLDDVTLTSPVGREYLCFDSASSQWVNQVIVLDDIGDVVIVSPTEGQHLVFDSGSSTWINKNSNGLDDLNDVTLTAEANGNFLRFNGSEWVNAALTPSDVPAVALDDLSDVSVASANSGDHLEFDGSNWIAASPGHTAPGASSLNDLSDVTLSGEVTNDLLAFNGADWVNVSSVTLSVVRAAIFEGTAAPTLIRSVGDGITFQDAFNNSILELNRVNSAVNFVHIFNSATGNAPRITADGSDTDLGIDLDPKGLGQVVSSTGFETSATDAYYLGDKDTDGTWRFVRNGSDLQVELRESGTYNPKGSFTP